MLCWLNHLIFTFQSSFRGFRTIVCGGYELPGSGFCFHTHLRSCTLLCDLSSLQSVIMISMQSLLRPSLNFSLPIPLPASSLSFHCSSSYHLNGFSRSFSCCLGKFNFPIRSPLRDRLREHLSAQNSATSSFLSIALVNAMSACLAAFWRPRLSCRH